MTVFRITTEKWCKSLSASGYPARWSARGKFVIYTAESRSLACLENLVHRSGEGSNTLFKVMLIEIPERLTIETIDEQTLTKNWHKIESLKLVFEIRTQKTSITGARKSGFFIK